MAKDAIIASIYSIGQREQEWPFNATTGTQVLTQGQTAYTFPSNLRTVKWDSFYIEKDDTIGNSTQVLRFVSRNYWDGYLKEQDLDAGSDGIAIPTMVFESHGFGFEVSPSPDEAYTVKYEYFSAPTALVNYNDQSNIPSIYDEAIIQGGLYHFYMFRDNAQQASMAEARFQREVDEMRTVLINKEDTMRSTLRSSNYRATGLLGDYIY